MEKRSFTKFWVIITAAFVLVGLILGAWFITLEVTKKDILESYNQQQLALVEGTAVGIEGLFEDLAASLGSLGGLPEIQYFAEAAARQELARKLAELAPQGITDIGILDAGGVAHIFTVDTEAEGIDYSWRSYFKAAQATQPDETLLPVIIELQTIGPGELGFMIAIPIFETAVDAAHPVPGGEFAGVIIGSLTFDTLAQRYIVPFKPPGDGQIFIVNDEYDIVWSSNSGMTWTSILGSAQQPFAMMSDQMDTWASESPRGGYYQFEHVSRWNKFELVAFAPVDIGDALWAIGVKTPDEIARQTSLSNFQGQQLVFIVSIATILGGVLVGGFVLRRETQRRFQLEEALQQSEVEQAIIAERNRLAGDLHDSVTQGLYGIVLHADAAKGQLTAGKTERAKAYLEEIKTTGKEGLAEMRLLIFELRPPVLEAEGLMAALETRLYAVEKRAGLKAEIRSTLEGRLPLEIEDGLYRIAQEILNNALKHARAQHIWVHLRQDGPVVRFEIADDGCGFDLHAARRSGGMGLSSMEARATKMGGKLIIESQPDEGTRTTVEVAI